MVFVGIFIATLLVDCSFLSEQINDSATVAGIVAVFFSLGCMAGELAYSALKRLLKSFSQTLFLAVCAVGIAASGFASTIAVLCVMIFIAGMGFSLTQSDCMMILSLKAGQNKIALVSAIMMALFNLVIFLSSSYEEIIGKLSGDSLYLPLYIGAIVLIVFAIASLILSVLRRKVEA